MPGPQAPPGQAPLREHPGYFKFQVRPLKAGRSTRRHDKDCTRRQIGVCIPAGRGINKGEDPLVSPSLGYFSWRRKKSTNALSSSGMGRLSASLSRFGPSATAHCSPLRRKCRGLRPPVFRSAWFAVRLLPFPVTLRLWATRSKPYDCGETRPGPHVDLPGFPLRSRLTPLPITPQALLITPSVSPAAPYTGNSPPPRWAAGCTARWGCSAPCAPCPPGRFSPRP